MRFPRLDRLGRKCVCCPGCVEGVYSTPIHGSTVDDWRGAMGIDWMTARGLALSIPPAYGEYLFSQMIAEVCRRGQAPVFTLQDLETDPWKSHTLSLWERGGGSDDPLLGLAPQPAVRAAAFRGSPSCAAADGGIQRAESSGGVEGAGRVWEAARGAATTLAAAARGWMVRAAGAALRGLRALGSVPQDAAPAAQPADDEPPPALLAERALVAQLCEEAAEAGSDPLGLSSQERATWRRSVRERRRRGVGARGTSVPTASSPFGSPLDCSPVPPDWGAAQAWEILPQRVPRVRAGRSRLGWGELVMLTALMHPSHAPLHPLSGSPSLFPSPEVEVARCATHVGAPEAEELREPVPEALAGPMADVGLAEPPSADALGVGGPPFSVSEETRDPTGWVRDSRPPRLSPSARVRTDPSRIRGLVRYAALVCRRGGSRARHVRQASLTRLQREVGARWSEHPLAPLAR
jgi:hypothetical protein